MTSFSQLLHPQYERYADRNPPYVTTIVDVKRQDDKLPYTLYPIGTSGSMRPTLYAPDIAIAQQIPYDQLIEGDIVVYKPKWNRGEPVMHRITLRDRGGWIASGDANARSESNERITADNYVAKIVSVIRKTQKDAEKAAQ